MLGCHNPPPPPEQTPPGPDRPGPDRPRADTPTPQSRHPHATRPPEQTPPQSRHPPGADASIRSMSGQYTSYWNAFLFFVLLPPANEVWGKVIFSVACVKNSVHRGKRSASVHARIPPPPSRADHPPPPGQDTLGPGTPPPDQAPPLSRHPPYIHTVHAGRYTVKKRAVFILLECNLVSFKKLKLEKWGESEGPGDYTPTGLLHFDF